jgi:hypothetical protein
MGMNLDPTPNSTKFVRLPGKLSGTRVHQRLVMHSRTLFDNGLSVKIVGSESNR